MNFLKFRWTSLLARLYVQIAVANHEDFAFHAHKKPGWWTWYAYMSLPYICYLNFWLKTIFYHHISFSYKAYRASLGWCGKDFPIHEEDTGRGYLWLWIIWGKSFRYCMEGEFAWFLFFDRGKINKQWWQDPEIWHDLNK